MSVYENITIKDVPEKEHCHAVNMQNDNLNIGAAINR